MVSILKQSFLPPHFGGSYYFCCQPRVPPLSRLHPGLLASTRSAGSRCPWACAHAETNCIARLEAGSKFAYGNRNYSCGVSKSACGGRNCTQQGWMQQDKQQFTAKTLGNMRIPGSFRSREHFNSRLQIVHQGCAFGVGGGAGFEEVGLDEIGIAELADPGAGGGLGFVAIVDGGEA